MRHRPDPGFLLPKPGPLSLAQASMHGAGDAKNPLLGLYLLQGLRARARTAGGADSQQVKSTDVTVYSAGAGWHFKTLLKREF